MKPDGGTDMLNLVEAVGIVLGLTGVFLMSSKAASSKEVRFFVFLVWFISALCLIYVGIIKHVVSLWLLQSVYAFFNVRGILNNR